MNKIGHDSFVPYFVGADTIFGALDKALETNSKSTFPPHNIYKLDSDNFVVELAVAGFGEDEINITLDNSALIIKGEPKDADTKVKYVHKGIAQRKFTKIFELAEHIKVEKATVDNGVLSIYLKKEIPEELKPKKIPIGSKKEFIRD